MTTYRDAGVDIEAGEETVRRIRSLVRKTFTPGVLADIGAFGAFFELDLGAYERPVLVSSVDGVGTKLKVAFRMGRHDTVGQDLVNHCVNDIAVCGARPLYFLDYFSTGRLLPDVVEAVVSGFAQACEENGCALIGGETAEMPDLYAEGEYDLAGTIVGVVEKAEILDGSRVEAGDVLLGIPSTGLHTNGYSLARKVLFARHDVHDAPPALGGETLGEALLRVHRSYLRPIRALIEAGCAHAFAHITGGGIGGNLRRVIPERPPRRRRLRRLAAPAAVSAHPGRRRRPRRGPAADVQPRPRPHRRRPRRPRRRGRAGAERGRRSAGTGWAG